MSEFSRVFTLEINGSPILAFEAVRMREAQELCKEAWLRDDLASLTSKGVPLLSAGAVLSVRPADTQEAITFGEDTSAIPPNDDLRLAYLVDLD